MKNELEEQVLALEHICPGGNLGAHNQSCTSLMSVLASQIRRGQVFILDYSGWKRIQSKFEQNCRRCSAKIHVDDPMYIRYKTKDYSHAICEDCGDGFTKQSAQMSLLDGAPA